MNSKKYFLFKISIFAIFIIFLFSEKSYATNPLSSVNLYAHGTSMTYVKDGGTFPLKYDKNSNRYLFCIDRGLSVPSSSKTLYKNDRTINKLALHVLSSMPKYCQGTTEPYKQEFYRTQTLMFLALGERKLKNYYDNTMKNHAAGSAIRNLGLSIYNQFISMHTQIYGTGPSGDGGNGCCKSHPKVSRMATLSDGEDKKQEKSITINVSPKEQNMYKSGSNYVTGWYYVSGTNLNSYDIVITEGTGQERVHKEGNKFYISVPINSIGNNKYYIGIKLVGTGSVNTEKDSYVVYEGSTSGEQDLVMYAKTGSSTSGSSTAWAGAYLDNCNYSPLPDQWVTSKAMNLTWEYYVKHNSGRNNVATLKIGNSYEFGAVVRYDYNVWWGGARSASNINDESIKILNKYKLPTKDGQDKENNKINMIDTTDKKINKNEDNIKIEKQNKNESNVKIEKQNKNESNVKIEENKDNNGCDIEVSSERAVASCPPREKPPKPYAGNHSSTIRYTINYRHEDGTIKSTQTGSKWTDNILLDTYENGTTWKYIEKIGLINVPNIERLTRAEITISIDNGNSFNIVMPIEYSFNKDISIDAVVTSGDDCSRVYKDDELSIGAMIHSNDIRTENFSVKLQASFNGGSYKDIETKNTYGVSRDLSGRVDFKYKIPEKVPNSTANVNNIRFRCIVYPNSSRPEASGKTANNTAYSKKTLVVSLESSDSFSESSVTNRPIYGLNGKPIISYIKVKKQDKTKPSYYKCSGCQTNYLGGTSFFCPEPGHLEYVYDDPYPAFIVKDANAVTGITEEVKITDVLIRSKWTKENKGTNSIDNNGYVNLVGKTATQIETLARLKAGYGFELKINTMYRNNLPQRFAAINKSNSVSSGLPNNSWTKYSYYSGSTANLIIKNRDTELKSYLTDNRPVIYTVPSIDEIPYKTPNQIFLKMPDGTILDTDNKLDLTNGSGSTVSKSTSSQSNYRETNNGTYLTRLKSFELKANPSYRKYYISKDVKNNKYEAVVSMPSNGIPMGCGSQNMLRDVYKFKFNIYGGYEDDLKTQLNE